MPQLKRHWTATKCPVLAFTAQCHLTTGIAWYVRLHTRCSYKAINMLSPPTLLATMIVVGQEATPHVKSHQQHTPAFLD